jgi:outer membrane protein assembly factor BamB
MRRLAALLPALSLIAQDDPDWQQWRVRQRHIFGSDYNPTQGIIVLPVDAKVKQALDTIAAFEKDRHFEEAARSYQALMEEYGAKVLPVEGDQGLYVGVKTWCERRLAASPDLLQAYRKLYDPSVTARLQRARIDADRAGAGEIADRHALATPGRELLLRLAAEEFENGGYDDALGRLRRCEALYPDSVAESIPLAALCLWRLKNVAGLSEMAERARRDKLDRLEVDSAGGRVRLGELIDSRLASLAADWEYTRMGDHFRGHPARFDSLKIKWRHSLTGETGGRSRVINPGRGNADAYLLASCASGRFIVNTNAKVVALDLATGKLVASRQADTGGTDPNAIIIRGWGEGETRQDSSFYGVSEKDGVAYCSLLRVDESGRGQKQGVRNLEAFDYTTSRLLYGVRDKHSSMLAPPEPVGDSLYLGVSHRDNNTTPPDVSVLRLDRSTGKILWSTFLCMNTGKNVPMFGPFSDAPPILVTYHAGLLFAASNSGCVAALEAATGDIRWIRVYDQSKTGMQPAPPLVFGDQVIFGGVDIGDEKDPNQGKVLAVDIASGRVTWDRKFKVSRDNPSFLEGVVDGKLLISGPTIICLSARTGKILWKQDVLYRIVGKGAVSTAALLVPSADGVEAYAVADGKHSTVYRWEDSTRDRGNLMLLENGLISYSDRTITRLSR